MTVYRLIDFCYLCDQCEKSLVVRKSEIFGEILPTGWKKLQTRDKKIYDLCPTCVMDIKREKTDEDS